MPKAFAREDNKPMTIQDLLDIINGEYVKNPKFLKKQVIMSQDEEGNGFSPLHTIEVTNQGITLWPM